MAKPGYDPKQPKLAREIRRRVYGQGLIPATEIIRVLGKHIKIEDAVNNLTYEEMQDYRSIYEGLRQAIQGLQDLERKIGESDRMNR